MSKMVKRAYFKVEGTGDTGSSLILTDLSPSKENLGQIELSLVSAEELANQFDTGFKTLDGFDDRVNFFDNMIQHRMPIERLLNDAEHEAYPLAVDNIFKINESDETYKATIIHQLGINSVSSLSHETGYMNKTKHVVSDEHPWQYEYALLKPELTEKLSSDNVQRFIDDNINNISDDFKAFGVVSLYSNDTDATSHYEYSPQSLDDQFTNVDEARSALILSALSGLTELDEFAASIGHLEPAERSHIEDIYMQISKGELDVYFTPGFKSYQGSADDRNLATTEDSMFNSWFKNADIIYDATHDVVGERALSEPDRTFYGVAALGIAMAADKLALSEPVAKPSSPKFSV